MYSQEKKKNDILGFAVFTQSGYKLGFVSRVEREKGEEGFKKIHVRRRLFRIFVGKPMIIDKSQILRVDDKKIIVDDAYVKIRPENIIYKTENA